MCLECVTSYTVSVGLGGCVVYVLQLGDQSPQRGPGFASVASVAHVIGLWSLYHVGAVNYEDYTPVSWAGFRGRNKWDLGTKIK